MPHFEFDGSQYEKASAHQTQWGQELISFLSLSGTESILDLGCGAVLTPFGGFRYKPKNKNSQRLFGNASPRPLGFFFILSFQCLFQPRYNLLYRTGGIQYQSAFR